MEQILNAWTAFLLGIIVGMAIGLAIMWIYREWDERDDAYDDDIGARKDEPPQESTGPSPELLARMDAAGMNTTHERWEDFDQHRRSKE